MSAEELPSEAAVAAESAVKPPHLDHDIPTISSATYQSPHFILSYDSGFDTEDNENVPILQHPPRSSTAKSSTLSSSSTAATADINSHARRKLSFKDEQSEELWPSEQQSEQRPTEQPQQQPQPQQQEHKRQTEVTKEVCPMIQVSSPASVISHESCTHAQSSTDLSRFQFSTVDAPANTLASESTPQTAEIEHLSVIHPNESASVAEPASSHETSINPTSLTDAAFVQSAVTTTSTAVDTSRFTAQAPARPRKPEHGNPTRSKWIKQQRQQQRQQQNQSPSKHLVVDHINDTAITSIDVRRPLLEAYETSKRLDEVRRKEFVVIVPMDKSLDRSLNHAALERALGRPVASDAGASNSRPSTSVHRRRHQRADDHHDEQPAMYVMKSSNNSRYYPQLDNQYTAMDTTLMATSPASAPASIPAYSPTRPKTRRLTYPRARPGSAMAHNRTNGAWNRGLLNVNISLNQSPYRFKDYMPVDHRQRKIEAREQQVLDVLRAAEQPMVCDAEYWQNWHQHNFETDAVLPPI